MKAPVGHRVSLRARELHERGAAAAAAVAAGLPDPQELAALAAPERHEILEGLRIELYAVAALLADAAVRRAYDARSSYPPYGLVRSMQSDVALMGTAPTIVEEGSVDGFYSLGKAYVETVVFHLHRQLAEPGEGWVLERLEELLSLFVIDAGPAARARMGDGLSFIYGGLHFGAGVSVQLVEVMSRLLDAFPAVGVDGKVDIISRSSRPAYQLATLNLDHVIVAYQTLQGPQRAARTPQGGLSLVSWMDDARFVVNLSDGQPWRIELRDDALTGPGPGGRRLEDRPTTYATHGCPARIPPSGGPSAIATLWTWCAQLARATGLLGDC